MGNSLPYDVVALYDRFAPGLYRYIYYRLGAQPIAEDLTAEVFVRVLKMARAPDDWRAYLYRIAHNLVVDYVRRNPHILQEPDEQAPGEHGNPVEQAEQEEERRILRRAIARLSPDQQQVIVLKFNQDLSNAEIATILDKPEGAVKALQHRALTNLRDWLAEPSGPSTWKNWNESTHTS